MKIKLLFLGLILLTVSLSSMEAQEGPGAGYDRPIPSKIAVIEYSAHLQDRGWTDYEMQPDMVGTTGERRRLEAFVVRSTHNSPVKIDLVYNAHGQDQGDIGWTHMGEVIGTTGQKKRLEAIAFYIADAEQRKRFSVYYRAHIQGENNGWTSWHRNGKWCGTKGRGLRLEAFQVMIVDVKKTGRREN